MLQFFRRHQKYFFIFITIVIVMTFAFFGTYQAFFTPTKKSVCKGKDGVVFYSADNKPVKRSYLESMNSFLAKEVWMQSERAFDVNYLNDGIISKDFLESGLSSILVDKFADHYRGDLQERLASEKSFRSYEHPYIDNISAKVVWSLFAPEMESRILKLQSSEDAISSFSDRVQLFLTEKNFPSHYLAQVLKYQESDYENSSKDNRLARGDVSLFGYHDCRDWFGNSFVQSVSEMVINTAAIARQKGYVISPQEVRTDIAAKSQKVFEMLSAKFDIPIQSGEELLQVYLSSNGLEEKTLINLWTDISLFRRMMHEMSTAALVDTLPLEQFYAYANQKVVIDLYQLPPELRFKNEDDARCFASYIDLVAPKDKYDMPTEYGIFDTIAIRAPELVGKHYRVFVGSVDKNDLQSKISLKETWDWELENWESLKTKFPELAQGDGDHFLMLENSKNRSSIDSYARSQIVDLHPEWIEEALKQANMKDFEFFFGRVHEGEPLVGIKDIEAFQKSLDEKNEVVGLTQDNIHYYRVLVDKKSENSEVLTFKEAKNKNLLTPSLHELRVSFVPYLEKYRFSLPEGNLAKQWNIEKRELSLSRTSPIFVSMEEAMAVQKGEFSSVKSHPTEGPYYFQVKDVFVDTTIPMNKWLETQELLSKELRVKFFEKLVSELSARNISL